jgi:hypothetical protein
MILIPQLKKLGFGSDRKLLHKHSFAQREMDAFRFGRNDNRRECNFQRLIMFWIMSNQTPFKASDPGIVHYDT